MARKKNKSKKRKGGKRIPSGGKRVVQKKQEPSQIRPFWEDEENASFIHKSFPTDEISSDSLNLSTINISFEPMQDHGYAELPPKVKKQLEKVHRLLKNPPMELATELEALVEAYPNVPAIQNYLTGVYMHHGYEDRAVQLLWSTHEQFPDYLFAVYSLGFRALLREDYEQFRTLFKDTYDLGSFCPDRDTFHFTEVVEFSVLMCRYCTRTQQLEQAKIHFNIVKQLDPENSIIEEMEVGFDILERLESLKDSGELEEGGILDLIIDEIPEYGEDIGRLIHDSDPFNEAVQYAEKHQLTTTHLEEMHTLLKSYASFWVRGETTAEVEAPYKLLCAIGQVRDPVSIPILIDTLDTHLIAGEIYPEPEDALDEDKFHDLLINQLASYQEALFPIVTEYWSEDIGSEIEEEQDLCDVFVTVLQQSGLLDPSFQPQAIQLLDTQLQNWKKQPIHFNLLIARALIVLDARESAKLIDKFYQSDGLLAKVFSDWKDQKAIWKSSS